MRFSCDACHAQYLISDEKVGPAGVKVRCKKCGHVIVVKRQVAAVMAPDPAPEAKAPPPSDGPGLDAALGAAFDGLAATRPAPAGVDEAGEEGEEGGVPDPEATRIVSPIDMSKPAEAPVAAVPAPAPSPAEWYVAIDDQQVGPISFEEVKRHWEEGTVGPASLCWRAGLADWTPIGNTIELADRLPAAVSMRSERPVLGVGSDGTAAQREVSASDDPWNLPAPQPTSEFEWKPTAGTALSALVQEEVASLGRPSPSIALHHASEELPPPESTGIRSLLANLPEPPPPEPSRVIPFRSPSGSQSPPKAANAPADPAKAAAPASRRSGLKNALAGGLVAAAVMVLAVVALAWAGMLPGRDTAAKPAPDPVPVAEVPKAAAPASAPAPDPRPEPVAAAPEPASAPPEAVVTPPAPPAAPAATTPAPEPVRPAKAPVTPAPVEPRKIARRERPAPAPAAVEARAPRPAPVPVPVPAPAPAPSGRRNDIDDLFEREFSGSGAAASKGAVAKAGGDKRADVYIPEAPGSARSKPERLGQGDVMAVVVGHKASIKKCVESYKTQGGGAGTLVMIWTIQQSGKTSGVKPKGSDHAPLAKCIGGLIQGWQFPEYAGSTMAPIEFPFQF